MAAKTTPSSVTKALNWAYDKALSGLPGTPTAQELGDSYLRKYADIDEAIDKLVSWQVAKCSASGFMSGLGGLITLPVAIPADLTATFYVNIRMVAAIAHMRGHDLRDDETRTAIFLCLIGDAAGEVLSKVGVELAEKFAMAQLKRLPSGVLKKINRIVGFKVAAKYGETGVFRLVKIVPLISGVVGGAVNGMSCRAIGEGAKRYLAS